MGILQGLMGNASRVEVAQVQTDLAPMLVEGETVHLAYRVLRDLVVFTNKRLISVNKQGLTGAKVEYMSIPYRNIQRFSVENAGAFDMDAELKVWVSGSVTPIAFTFGRGESVAPIARGLATYVLG